MARHGDDSKAQINQPVVTGREQLSTVVLMSACGGPYEGEEYYKNDRRNCL